MQFLSQQKKEIYEVAVMDMKYCLNYDRFSNNTQGPLRLIK